MRRLITYIVEKVGGAGSGKSVYRQYIAKEMRCGFVIDVLPIKAYNILQRLG